MTRTEAWDRIGAEGQTIFGDTHLPDGEPRGAILLCHGFKGYKDYGLFPQLADRAAKSGLVAHRFNFSHSGMTRNVDTFERPDLFERDTWGRQMFDLQTVASAVAAGDLPGGTQRQVWFGHSRGGLAVLLTAAEAWRHPDGAVQPVAVISASAPASTQGMDDDQKAMLRRVGRMASPSARTGQTLFVGTDWLDDVEASPQRYDLSQQLPHIDCPVLLLHGDQDATIDPQDAHRLLRYVDGQTELRPIGGASHTFNAPNPLALDESAPPQTQQVLEAVCEFAVKSLAR